MNCKILFESHMILMRVWNLKAIFNIKARAITHIFALDPGKDTLIAFENFKDKQKSVIKHNFLTCKNLFIYSVSLCNTSHIEIKWIHYRICLGQNKNYLSRAPTHNLSFTFLFNKNQELFVFKTPWFPWKLKY